MSLITISQSVGSMGLVIARRVGQALDLDIYDDERLKAEALRLGVHAQELNNLAEKAPGFFNRYFSKRPEIYQDILETVIFEISRKDQGIVIGHGSQFLLRDFSCALHVLIHAPLDQRVRRIMEQQSLDQETAEKLVEKSDNAQKGFFQYAFNMHWDNPTLYDLVINPNKLGPDAAANLIVEAASPENMNSCSLSALEAMGRLGLVKKIEVALLRNGHNISILQIEADQGGIVRIGGYAPNMNAIADIVQTVKALEDVTAIESQIGDISKLAEV
jgi:cytidylate kinase